MSDEEQKKILWWIIATLLGSVGLNQGINKITPEVRNDPFTGAQGQQMERRLDKIYSVQQTMLYRMSRQEAWRKECRITVQDHLRQHP
jgi:hypothetical protein